MSEDWLMRQDPRAAVIVAQSLVEHPERLEYVLLDEEDDWLVSDGSKLSGDAERNRERYASMCLHDTVELVPQLTALAELPAGMGANWNAETATWELLSPTDPHDDEEASARRAARVADWPHPGSPTDKAYLSLGLTEIATAADAPARGVRYANREEDGTWMFVGFEVPDPDEQTEVEVDTLELGHVAELYPDVVELLDAEPGEVFFREAPDAEWLQVIDDGE
ncbi:hypothetical protein [Amycolatopsis orientalis]|uniref:hypothetical protein n=1 Tax=Amycolatopsis orientalis TaxID=31958 RepID=UPI0003A620B9|nr:hypothetical protein [Amycolatopsis orientalis]